MALVSRRWDGLTLLERINRAGGRSIVGIGLAVSRETKIVTHVWKNDGTLRRSVHVSPLKTFHDDDEHRAKTADLLTTSFETQATPTPYGPAVEVGSWVSYACVEWVGRKHPGVTQGLEVVRGVQADAIVAQAFREEGLR